MIAHGVRAAGFRFVSLDLAGIQSGAFTLPLVTRSPEPEAEPSPEPAGEPVETSRDRPGE
jgi:uncharacterized protein